MNQTTASTFHFSFTWPLADFSRCPDLVKSPLFSAPAPFNRISWRLWVHPNGCDAASKGYVAVLLELMKGEKESEDISSLNGSSSPTVTSTSRSVKLTSASVVYKLGIINSANKMVDYALEENDFSKRPVGKPKLFMRNRLINNNWRESESILKGDALTFRFVDQT